MLCDRFIYRECVDVYIGLITGHRLHTSCGLEQDLVHLHDISMHASVSPLHLQEMNEGVCRPRHATLAAYKLLRWARS